MKSPQKLRFNCPYCTFDEQRNSDAADVQRINALMERLYTAHQSEISVRMFVKYCWPE